MKAPYSPDSLQNTLNDKEVFFQHEQEKGDKSLYFQAWEDLNLLWESKEIPLWEKFLEPCSGASLVTARCHTEWDWPFTPCSPALSVSPLFCRQIQIYRWGVSLGKVQIHGNGYSAMLFAFCFQFHMFCCDFFFFLVFSDSTTSQDT